MASARIVFFILSFLHKLNYTMCRRHSRAPALPRLPAPQTRKSRAGRDGPPGSCRCPFASPAKQLSALAPQDVPGKNVYGLSMVYEYNQKTFSINCR
jgi:hypothetical protein